MQHKPKRVKKNPALIASFFPILITILLYLALLISPLKKLNNYKYYEDKQLAVSERVYTPFDQAYFDDALATIVGMTKLCILVIIILLPLPIFALIGYKKAQTKPKAIFLFYLLPTVLYPLILYIIPVVVYLTGTDFEGAAREENVGPIVVALLLFYLGFIGLVIFLPNSIIALIISLTTYNKLTAKSKKTRNK